MLFCMHSTCCSPLHQAFFVPWVGQVYVNEIVAGFHASSPFRAFLGLASIVLLSVTLFLRVRVVRYGCRLPTQKMVADEER